MSKFKGDKAGVRKVIGMDDRIIMLIGIPTLGLLIPLVFFRSTPTSSSSDYLIKAFISVLYCFTYWLTVRIIMIYFRRRLPDFKQFGKRIFYNFLALVPMYVLINRGLALLFFQLGLVKTTKDMPSLDINVISILLILLISAIYESVWLYDRWKESIIAQESLGREYVKSQLEGLRSQVNPHFLFNSLNTLTYLIPEDADRAVTFVQKMSKVYRYILEFKDQKLVSLEEELKFLEAYIFLLKERFGDNLNVIIQIPNTDYGLHLIPLSLQMLMENVIKHNVISVDKPLEVNIWVEDEQLMVKNNLQRKAQTVPSTQVGLENIRHRYSFYTKKAMKVKETPTDFVVGLPLLKSAALAS